MSALAMILLGVTVTVFPPSVETEAIFNASPSGKKQVLVYTSGTSASDMQSRVVLRRFSDDGSYTDQVICGDEAVEIEGVDPATRERRVGLVDYVVLAGRFHWLDDDRLLFNLKWYEGGKERESFVLYDGSVLRVVDMRIRDIWDWDIDGNQILAPRRTGSEWLYEPWLLLELHDDGTVSVRELHDLESTEDVYNNTPARLSHGRVYFTRVDECGNVTRYRRACREILRRGGPDVRKELRELKLPRGCRELGLWSYDLRTGELKQVCKHHGRIQAKSRQGYIAYTSGRRNFTDEWRGEYPDNPDLVVIDTTGAVYTWSVPEEPTGLDAIGIWHAIFSPDGEQVLVDAWRGEEEYTVWERYYVVDWRRGVARQIRPPQVEGNTVIGFRYWSREGIWWNTYEWDVVLSSGFEEVTE